MAQRFDKETLFFKINVPGKGYNDITDPHMANEESENYLNW